MWRAIVKFALRLRLNNAIQQRLQARYREPGWVIGAGPPTGAMPAYVPPPPLPEGMRCPWGLRCDCGLCLREMPPDAPFTSRIVDPNKPRTYWM